MCVSRRSCRTGSPPRKTEGAPAASIAPSYTLEAGLTTNGAPLRWTQLRVSAPVNVSLSLGLSPPTADRRATPATAMAVLQIGSP